MEREKSFLFKKVSIFIIISLTFSLIICVFNKSNYFAFASSEEINGIYKEIATNFFKAQYSERQIEYNDLSIILEKDLYNDNEETVAKAIVLQRDKEYDYIVLNLATTEIDEFVFNAPDALEKFSDKLYYTGLLDYYIKEDDNFIDMNTEEIHTIAEFRSRTSYINDKLATLKQKSYRFADGNTLPNPKKNGWDGFYDWSKIYKFNNSNGYSNTKWGYLRGIHMNGEYGGLSFMDQNTFNSYFGTDNACGPTACVNMFIWFQYKSVINKNGIVNTLVNGNEFDTFNRFRVLLGHTNTNGTNRNKYGDAIKTYAKEMGYGCNIYTGIDTYSEFMDNINQQRPVITSIDLSGWGGHAVVVVGYEEFRQSYEEKHQFLWWKWTTTEYKYNRYLRIIDGWGTSNNSRYIDVSGYWDTLTGRGVALL